jgi:hypothetical protein
MVSLLSACCAYYFCSHKKSCLATYSLRIFLIDVSNRFKKIKEHVNLPKYPLAAEFLTPWHRPSRCLLTPWRRPSCLLPKPWHRRSWRRRLPLTERPQPSQSTILSQESTSPITYNWPPVNRFIPYPLMRACDDLRVNSWPGWEFRVTWSTTYMVASRILETLIKVINN